jgi:hypothetical protein
VATRLRGEQREHTDRPVPDAERHRDERARQQLEYETAVLVADGRGEQHLFADLGYERRLAGHDGSAQMVRGRTVVDAIAEAPPQLEQHRFLCRINVRDADTCDPVVGFQHVDGAEIGEHGHGEARETR